MSTGVILLAAGLGRRFGGRIPKQLARLNGQPLFLKPLKIFAGIPSVGEIVIVVSKSLHSKVQGIVRRFKTRKKIILVLGGPFRGQSVKNGFRALSGQANVVLVHDSARPLVERKVVKRVEAAAKKFGVALAGWPLGDTLKLIGQTGQVIRTIPRKKLWLAQTPQGFRREIAEICLNYPKREATDDAKLAEAKGYKVKIVRGSPVNLKVTSPHDLRICRALL